MDNAGAFGPSSISGRRSFGQAVRSAARRLLATAGDTAPPPVEYTPQLVAFVGTCAAIAVIAAVATFRPVNDVQTLVVTTLIILTMARMSVRRVTGVDMTFSATVLLQIGATVTFGAAGAIAAALAEGIGVQLRRNVGWFRFLFNISNLALTDLAAWGAYSVAQHTSTTFAVRTGLAGISAGLVHWAVNYSLLAGVFSARERTFAPGLKFMRGVTSLIPSSLLYGLAAVAFPILDTSLGTIGVLALVGPLISAQIFLVSLGKTAAARNAERQSHVELVEAKNTELQLQRVEVVRAYDATLIALTNALDARDKETEGHSRRVVEYCRAIGRCIGLDGDRMRVLSHGALLHDIGKIGVPDAILLKPAKLTEEEWELMRRHPVIGEAMVRDVDVLREARRIILHHHERWDGSGYPRGLRGTEIDLGARIFAVADACDAITQDRPYRRARALDEARAEVVRGRGKEFDPEAVDAFLGLEENELLAIQRLRTPPGLDLLVGSDARARYLASLGLGHRLIPA